MQNLLKITFFLVFLSFSINIYAEDYEYYFENISGDKASSTNSHSNSGIFFKMELWINDTFTITARIEKKDKTYFDGNGSIFLQVNTYDNTEIQRIECEENNNVGTDFSKTITSIHTLFEMPVLWPDDKLKVYARYENNDKWAWTGPIIINRKASQKSGSLFVLLHSESARDKGAAWSYEVANNTWSPWYKSSEESMSGIKVGKIKVKFKPVDSWFTPITKTVEIRNNQLTNIEASYICKRQTLLVNVAPSQAIDAGASWYIKYELGESTDYRPNEPVEDIEVGEKEVFFNPIKGWKTPDSQIIYISESEPAIITGIYCKEKPYAPQNLKVSQGELINAVRLTWDPVLCSNKYEVFRSLIDIPTAEGSITTQVNTNYYIDTKVEPGQEYYYWVRAVKDKYPGEFSNYKTGYSKLEKPENVVASDGSFNEKIRIEWDPVPGAVSYKIYRNTDNNPSSAKIPIASDIENTVYFDSSVEPELKYYYWVTAESALKESKKSFSDKGFARLGTPRFLDASDSKFSDAVIICWQPVFGDPFYELDRISSTKKRTNNSKTVTQEETCMKDENAIPGKVYYYRVRAKNKYGVGNYSKIEQGSRSMAKPDLYASKRTHTDYISLKWSNIESATRYYIYQNTVDDYSTATQIAESITNLYNYPTNNTEKFYFWVEAVNQHTYSISNSDMGYISDNCEFSFSETKKVVDAFTGLGEIYVNVESQISCKWDVVSAVDWIEILSNSSGTQSEIVKFKASENRSLDKREGRIIVAGETIMVEQKGAESTTLTIHKNGEGSVKINNEKCNLPYTKKVAKGDIITIEAIPDENWMFSNFYDNSVITSDNPRTITIDDDKNIIVTFTKEEFCLNVEVIGDGQIFIAGEETSQKCFPKGANVNLMALNKPDSVYFFTNWSGDIQDKKSLVSVLIDGHKNIKALFSGWAADIYADGLNLGGYYKSEVTFGVSLKQFQTESPPDPPRYSSLMKLSYNDRELSNDIRLEGKTIYQWILVVDPHGNMGPPQEEQQTVLSWNPDSFSLTGTYQLIDGKDPINNLDDLNNKTILIKNMREIKDYTVTGLSENKYFSLVWVPPYVDENFQNQNNTSEPISISLKCEAENSGGAYKFDAKIGIDRFGQTKPFPPLAPVYSALMYLLKDNKPLTLDIRNYDQSKYEWLLMVQPVGNAQPLGSEGTVKLSWDFSDPNYKGTFKLIKQTRQLVDDEVIIEDMSIISECSITGDESKQYFKIVLEKGGNNELCEYNFDLEKGWNLISLPIIPEQNLVKYIIPDAEIVYQFNGAGYDEISCEDKLIAGNGYWVLVPSKASYNISGQCFNNFNKNLNTGWHLLGCTNSHTTPETALENSVEIMYEYIDGSYEIVTECTPGYGFWVNMLESSEFTLNPQ